MRGVNGERCEHCHSQHVHSAVPIDQAARASPRTRHGDSLGDWTHPEPTPGPRMVAGAGGAPEGGLSDFAWNHHLGLARRRRLFSTPESARDDPGLSGYLPGILSTMSEPADRSGHRGCPRYPPHPCSWSAGCRRPTAEGGQRLSASGESPLMVFLRLTIAFSLSAGFGIV